MTKLLRADPLAARAILERSLSEAEWQAVVVEAASYLGWLSYHTFDSRRSPHGFPDLVLCRPPQVVFVELKSERGRMRPEQERWLTLLGACPGVRSFCWRPADWPEVMEVLT